MGKRKRRWISAQQIVEAYDNDEITMTAIQGSLSMARKRTGENSKRTAEKWQEARDTIMNRPDQINYAPRKQKD